LHPVERIEGEHIGVLGDGLSDLHRAPRSQPQRGTARSRAFPNRAGAAVMGPQPL
jgi:hypothetical protein